jgi:glycine/D-amino acid oxidase-like deaminating enzyme
MTLNSGLPFSLIRYGLPFNYPKLEADISTEVVIIGGGVSGALSAFFLNEAGIDCVVVDKRTIGLGSTAASTSLLQYEIDVSLTDLSAMRGEEDAVRAYKLCNDALHKMKNLCSQINFSGFAPTDSLYYGVKKKDEQKLRTECDKRRAINLDVEFLDSQMLRSLYTIGGHGGILSSNAAYADAYCLTHALFQHCLAKGLSIYDRTTVKKVREKSRSVELTTADHIKIKARHVIYATGYETTEALKKRIVTLRSTYVTISESLTDCDALPFHRTLIWNTADPYLYTRCTPEGRILVGGRDDPFSNPLQRDKSISKKTKQLVHDFKKLIPSVPFIPEFSWAGTFASSKDGLPFIGRYPGKKRSYYALGFGGNGIIFSLIAAEIIRDLIIGRRNDDEDLFRFDRA